MSNIKLNNFIDINIKRHITPTVTSTRDTAVLLYIVDTAVDGALSTRTTIYNNITEITDSPDWLQYAKTYFENGGIKLAVINTSNAGSVPQYLSDLNSISYEWIVVSAYIDAAIIDLSIQNIATAYNSISEHEGIYKKFFVETISETPSGAGIDGYITKWGTSTTKDVCMTIPAYLSQINVYSAGAVKDYAFTEEQFTTEAGRVFDDNDIVKGAIENNYNVAAPVINTIVNIGGNDSAGNDLVNNYVLTILHQTLTVLLTQLLLTHIKYDSAGIGKIASTLAAELQRYLYSGYLTIDKVWTDSDLIYKDELIMANNEPLSNGYKIIIMPQNKVVDPHIPEIYILIADSYGIRKISISGEVF